jgi:hypothetical protein
MPTPGLSATLAEIESEMVLMGFTAAQIASFASYYHAAAARDPAITPEQAYTAWAAGTAISSGAQAEANALGLVVNKGLPAAAAAVPTVTNPLDFLRNIGAFFDKLSQASTWLRIGEFILGAALVIVGVAKLASGTAAGKAATKIATKAALL